LRAICFAPSLADSFIFLTLTRLVVVIILRISVSPYSPPSRRLSATDLLVDILGQQLIKSWVDFNHSTRCFIYILLPCTYFGSSRFEGSWSMLPMVDARPYASDRD
jgi:hypothetical protein